MASVSGNLDPELTKLFQSFYGSYPEENRENVWYLTLTSALTALGSPSLTGPLFTYVTKKNPNLTPGTVSNRIRETLLKIFTLVGVAPVLASFFALAEAERAAGLDPDVKTEAQGQILHDDMALNPENYDRGGEFLRMLYQHNLEPIVEKMGRHGGEIMHMERHVIYGLYLANFKVLNPKETELVVFPALLCGGTRGAAEWHIRGTRRVGVEWDDIRKVTDCLSMVADWVLGSESAESSSRSRQEIVPGKGRSEWIQWTEGVQKGMEAEESA